MKKIIKHLNPEIYDIPGHTSKKKYNHNNINK